MEDDRRIRFGDELLTPSAVRYLAEMSEVVYDGEWLKGADKKLELYYMYRGLAANPEDRKKLEEANLRYDITVVPSNLLGCEYTKTLGHYHPTLPNSELTYPEIYEILEGKAHYLLQSLVGGKVTDVILIEAKKGEIVIIPPNYGHITINPFHEELKMANLVARDFSSLYDPIKEKGGGAYFELTNGWVKNENYPEVPELRVLKPVHGIFEEDVYRGFMENSSEFEFLTCPQEYPGLFEEINLL